MCRYGASLDLDAVKQRETISTAAVRLERVITERYSCQESLSCDCDNRCS